MSRYNEELRKAGVLLALDGLHPPGDGGARQLRAAASATVTDGPFTEAKEVVGGYWLIQARSKEEAVEWASRCPGRRTARIEVRQVFEMADFPTDVQAARRARPAAAQTGAMTATATPARDRGGLADRVRPPDRRAGADGARRRPRRGPRAGRAGRGAGDVAASRASRTTRAPG